jgi:hypothetical protein
MNSDTLIQFPCVVNFIQFHVHIMCVSVCVYVCVCMCVCMCVCVCARVLRKLQSGRVLVQNSRHCDYSRSLHFSNTLQHILVLTS